MKLSEIDKSVSEGKIGDSLKAAKAAGLGMVGKAASSGFGMGSRFLDAATTSFGTAIGMDASRPSALKTQQNLAKSNFVAKFVQKMSGFISSTEESVKDDIVKMQQQAAQQAQAQQAQAQQAQAQQAQAQQAQAAQRGTTVSQGGIVIPPSSSARPRESVNFNLMLKRVLKEDQNTDQFIKQYAGTIKQAITNYMSGNLGNLAGQVDSASKEIAQSVVAKKDYSQILKDLGEAIFDSYYSQQRSEYVQSKPAANIPLSPEAQQVLANMKTLEPEEQQAVIQKLNQHTI